MSEYTISYSNTPLRPSSGSGFIPNAALGITTSGVFADGQTFTINVPGGGLGARSTPLPVAYYPFETNLSTHPTLSRTTNTMVGATTNTFIQSGVMPVNAAGSVQYIPVPGGGGTATAFSSNGGTSSQPLCNLNSTGAGFQVYGFQKRYYGFASNPSNDKFTRIWTNPTSGGYPNAYFGFLTGSGNLGNVENNGTHNNLGVPPGNSNNAGTMPGPLLNTWHTDELWGREATIDVVDGIWNWARQGTMAYDLSGTWIMNMSAATPSQNANCFNGWFLDEVTNSPPNGTTDTAYTAITVCDDSWLQTIMTDESGTYSWGQHNTVNAVVANREWQPQTARSNTQITIVVRQGAYPSLSGISLMAITGYGTSIYLGVGA